MDVCVCVSAESLSVVDDEDTEVGQLAHTLQACLELKEPVQQVKLVKKVRSAAPLFSDSCHTLSQHP